MVNDNSTEDSSYSPDDYDAFEAQDIIQALPSLSSQQSHTTTTTPYSQDNGNSGSNNGHCSNDIYQQSRLVLSDRAEISESPTPSVNELKNWLYDFERQNKEHYARNNVVVQHQLTPRHGKINKNRSSKSQKDSTSQTIERHCQLGAVKRTDERQQELMPPPPPPPIFTDESTCSQSSSKSKMFKKKAIQKVKKTLRKMNLFKKRNHPPNQMTRITETTATTTTTSASEPTPSVLTEEKKKDIPPEQLHLFKPMDDVIISHIIFRLRGQMQIHVKIPSTARSLSVADTSLQLDIHRHDTVRRVKRMIFEKTGIRVAEQRLLYSDQQLFEDDSLLSEYIRRVEMRRGDGDGSDNGTAAVCGGVGGGEGRMGCGGTGAYYNTRAAAAARRHRVAAAAKQQQQQRHHPPQSRLSQCSDDGGDGIAATAKRGESEFDNGDCCDSTVVSGSDHSGNIESKRSPHIQDVIERFGGTRKLRSAVVEKKVLSIATAPPLDDADDNIYNLAKSAVDGGIVTTTTTCGNKMYSNATTPKTNWDGTVVGGGGGTSTMLPSPMGQYYKRSLIFDADGDPSISDLSR
eukprot:CAMPEP_0172485416 /NCGR_PEP_ID=MMETSP1066-20121228/13478_1 /TAXON_ID=671091 /ORGANISM="Coscinodiscus wailesii, Strain CCMP2513" /LENGTH=573 /DNA_ID=CAMNT_0013250697 /DNA_START=209 /DNA_END=1930 /DNA_ORIENTATION=+